MYFLKVDTFFISWQIYQKEIFGQRHGISDSDAKDKKYQTKTKSKWAIAIKHLKNKQVNTLLRIKIEIWQ